MKVADLIEDLETGDRSMEHLSDAPPKQAIEETGDFATSIAQMNELARQLAIQREREMMQQMANSRPHYQGIGAAQSQLAPQQNWAQYGTPTMAPPLQGDTITFRR